MDFSLSKEEQLIQKAAAEYAEKFIEPVAKQIDEENKVPDEIIRGLGELDLFGIPFDEEYGGAGAGYLCYVLAMEQIAAASSGVGMILSAHTLGLGAIDKFGTEEQKKKYMFKPCRGEEVASFAFTEPGTGSDPKQIATTARKEGDYYIINGTKRFISNAGYPGPIVVFAKEEETGKVSGFIVEKWCEGYSISEPWEKLGMHGGPLLDVYLKDVKVPAENLLGGPGMGYAILQFAISFGKVGVSACALGGAEAACREAFKYAKEKMHRDQPITKFQGIRLALAEIAERVEACRWLTYRLGYLADNVKNPAQFAKEAALTKDFICAQIVDISRLAVNVHGSYGLMKDYKVERLWRDAIMGLQIEGVSDMQKEIVAGVIIGSK
ncbi:acyl-CoA dehydrogenase family protein [Thermosyntropha sp.]|uniref:acyl-CoA dehydrogenase family protein n=1 Tax=Thermosyntropha sp. TaxID=2740820 RepID=UPI0025E1FE89|nr:acyl-CoA dehydrogenase family protein [Thermosyntropha sp.]MBO8158112.1 acyl-CoA dehydrogenase family protein [Thermosyntropha sp.]